MDPFTKKVRVRSCGILLEKESILLLKHMGIGPVGFLWGPPGGGVEFGESLEEALIREFKEETGLTVTINRYLFCNEFLGNEHHALEFFYEVHRDSGSLQLGTDPEIDPNSQMLADIRFFNEEELEDLPADGVHSIFRLGKTPSEVMTLNGLFKFDKNCIK